MVTTSWLRQTSDKPLFLDMLWNQPENTRQAGRLLIVGGNTQSFSAVSTAYGHARQAGVGSIRIIVPDSLARVVAKIFPEAEFAPSTPSGSFARSALATILDASEWADGILLAGGFGKNSETAILLESLVKKQLPQLTMVGDSLDYFLSIGNQLTDRPQTTIVAEVSQLQKLLAHKALIKHSMDLIQLISSLENIDSAAAVVTYSSGQAIVLANRRVSTTEAKNDLLKIASFSVVWRLQQPKLPFEALSTAIYCSGQSSSTFESPT